ncbi:MAG: acetolactate synthase small subunit, partial [Dehalococcoidia bacterium]|nr:acetolactate synthase small subunit [Dehalococcoidia bacterium]
IEIADIFRASIVDVAADSLTIEITGDEDKLDSLLNLLRSFGIKEVARTGSIAMLRGSPSQLRVEEKPLKTRKARYNLL